MSKSNIIYMLGRLIRLQCIAMSRQKNGNFKNQKETQGKLCVCLLLIYNIKNDGKCDFLTFL